MLLQYFTISPVLDTQEEPSSEKNYLPKTLQAKFLIVMWMPISHTAHLLRKQHNEMFHSPLLAAEKMLEIH